MDCVFIDFSNAYNSINRPKLFEILKTKQILPINEIDFLFNLYTNIYFEDPITNEKIYFQNGVP